jgi:hypothetical protein
MYHDGQGYLLEAALAGACALFAVVIGAMSFHHRPRKA